VRYLQLAHNEWDAVAGQATARVLYSFGREDRLDRAAIARLVASLSRVLEPGDAPAAAGGGDRLPFVDSRPLGGAWALDGLWRRLGIDRALAGLLEGRRLDARAGRDRLRLVAPPRLPGGRRRGAQGAPLGRPPRRRGPRRPPSRQRRPRAAGLGGRRDRGVVRRVRRGRRLAPQARPPRLLPASRVGLGVHRVPRPRCSGEGSARPTTAGADRQKAVARLGRAAPPPGVGLRRDALPPRQPGGDSGPGPGLPHVDPPPGHRRGDLHRGRRRVHRRAARRGAAHSRPRHHRRRGPSPSTSTTPAGRSWSPGPTTARR